MEDKQGGTDTQEKRVAARREKIREAFDAPGLGHQLSRLQADAHRRIAQQACLRVLHWDPKDPRADDLWPVRGSIALFFARRGNQTVLDLETAYATSDLKTLARLGKKLQEANLKREPSSVERAASLLMETPCYFDLAYDGKLLAPFVAPVGDVEVGNLNFAYNGGDVNPDKFQLVERFRIDSREGLETFAVMRPPRLTELEREVLRRIPPSQDQIHIGSAAACPAATVVIVLIITAVTVAGQACANFRDRLAEVALTPSDIEHLGTVASASELLSRRRAVFEQFGV